MQHQKLTVSQSDIFYRGSQGHSGMLYLTVIGQVWTKLWLLKVAHLENRRFSHINPYLDWKAIFFHENLYLTIIWHREHEKKISDRFHLFLVPVFQKNLEKIFFSKFAFSFFSLWRHELRQNFIPPSERAWKDDSNEW